MVSLVSLVSLLLCHDSTSGTPHSAPLDTIVTVVVVMEEEMMVTLASLLLCIVSTSWTPHSAPWDTMVTVVVVMERR